MSESENFIKKGTTLFTAKPFAYVLYSKYRNERCDYCFKSGKLFRCSVCKCIYYCNQSCQQMSWTIHSKECASLKRFSSKVIPDVARLMARIIIKLNQGGGEEIGYYSKTKYRKFKDLMSHYSDIKKDEKKMEHFVCVCGVLYEFLGDMSIPNSAELMGIYGRIYINSFNISDLDMNNIGAGIYLGPSILDHSCKPNAVATFEGTTIIIRTTEDLPCLDLSQIRISYIDVIKTTKDRREELQSSYYFWCNCKKCEESEPMVEAAACPNKFCTYPCSLDADMCENCNTKFPDDGLLDRSFLEDTNQVSPQKIQHEELDSESDTETANPLVAGYEDDLSSADEATPPIQPKLAENPLSKQKHKRETLSNTELNSEKLRQMTKRDSISSIEQELQISSNYDINEQQEINSDAFDSWLRRDSKWRQSPEGGEDVSSNSTRKDRLELSDKSLDVSVTSSNVHLELLDNTSVRHMSSDGGSPVLKEKKKHKEKTEDKEKKKKKKSKDKEKDKEKTDKADRKKKRSLHRSRDENRERDELEEFLNGSVTRIGVDVAYEAI